MGATRVIGTAAVIGIAGGVCLAWAMAPAFAPWRNRVHDRRDEQPEIVFDGADHDGSSAGYGSAAPRRDEGDGFAIEPGPREGTIVLQVPQWIGESAGWLAMGRRMLGELGGADDPGSGEFDQPPEHYAPPRDRNAEAPFPPQAARDETPPAGLVDDTLDAAGRAAETAHDVARAVQAAEGDQ